MRRLYQPSGCAHEFVGEARNVMAYIDREGCLSSDERARSAPAWSPIHDRWARPIRYARIVSCCNRTCEKVFAAERAP